jgi:hypothetical protein
MERNGEDWDLIEALDALEAVGEQLFALQLGLDARLRLQIRELYRL